MSIPAPIKSHWLFFIIAIIIIGGEVKAQTLIPDEVSLERAVYANLQKGIAEFHGITEKHTFILKNNVDLSTALTELKTDRRVITAIHDKKLNAAIVTITKTELNEAKFWLQPVIEKSKAEVSSHSVQYYLKTDQK